MQISAKKLSYKNYVINLHKGGFSRLARPAMLPQRETMKMQFQQKMLLQCRSLPSLCSPMQTKQ